MKKILFLFCICFLFIKFSQAQITFQKTFGGTNDDVGNSVQQTADGGYIITGYTASFGAGNSDIYLVRTDANGDSLWTKTFGGTNWDDGFSVQQTTDGGFIIAGNNANFGAGSYDVFLVRTDANGNSLWTKTFGGIGIDGGQSVQQTADGGYIIAGSTLLSGAGFNDVYLIKTDANGDSLWTKTYGGTDDDYSFSIQQTSDGGYIITGFTYSFGAGTSDVYLIRSDSNGDSLWTKTFGGINFDYGFSVQQTADGGYIIAGQTNSFNAGGEDVYLIKTDADGNVIWTKTYGGTNHDVGNSVQQTADGGYIITGYTDSFGAGLIDFYLIKTDAAGDSLWTKTFGGTGGDYGNSVQQAADGGYIITGWTNSFGAGNDDIYLIKTDSLGNSGCNEGTTTTLVTVPATQVSNPASIVASPPTIVTSPAAIAGSGSIVTTLCTTVGINEITTNNLFFISPNPFTNDISIILQMENPSCRKQNINQATISIKNILGQTVFTFSNPPMADGKGYCEFDLSFLEKGIYLLEIIINGERTVKKIVKE